MNNSTLSILMLICFAILMCFAWLKIQQAKRAKKLAQNMCEAANTVINERPRLWEPPVMYKIINRFDPYIDIKACYKTPAGEYYTATICSFHYDPNDPDDKAYAELCAEELFDKLTERI